MTVLGISSVFFHGCLRAFLWNSGPGPQLEAGSWPPHPLPRAGLCVDWPLSAKLTDSWLTPILLSSHFYLLTLQHLKVCLIPETLLQKLPDCRRLAPLSSFLFSWFPISFLVCCSVD